MRTTATASSSCASRTARSSSRTTSRLATSGFCRASTWTWAPAGRCSFPAPTCCWAAASRASSTCCRAPTWASSWRARLRRTARTRTPCRSSRPPICTCTGQAPPGATSTARRWSGRAPITSRAYLWGENDTLKAYKLSERQVRRDRPAAARAPTAHRKACRAACWRFRATARRREPASSGRSCRWTATPTWARGVQGILLALDAQDVRRQLWTSEQSGAARSSRACSPSSRRRPWRAARSSSRPMATSETPRVYGGNTRPQQFPARYYVAVYGLLPHPPHLKPIVNQSRDDVTVTSATATDALTLDHRRLPAGRSGQCRLHGGAGPAVRRAEPAHADRSRRASTLPAATCCG